MIIPCIDLMDGKVVQLVQGRDKALEGDSPLAMLERFAAFPEIQVIDLDAAMGRGSNDAIVEMLASRAAVRVGGGVRTPERAATLVAQGARKVIIGTSAFTNGGVNHAFLREITSAAPRERLIIALLGARTEQVPFVARRLCLGQWQRVLLFGFTADPRADYTLTIVG